MQLRVVYKRLDQTRLRQDSLVLGRLVVRRNQQYVHSEDRRIFPKVEWQSIFHIRCFPPGQSWFRLECQRKSFSIHSPRELERREGRGEMLWGVTRKLTEMLWWEDKILPRTWIKNIQETSNFDKIFQIQKVPT